LLRPEDILHAIKTHGESVALVMFSGLNYFTGQVYDMAEITKAGHAVGAMVGFDLAHAAGNIPLQLHDWGADFAVWCTYKYLNSGPGSLAGAFVHEKHGNDASLPRFAGWWGHDEARRFLMEKSFIPIPGAEGWQLSNAPIFAFAPMLPSHDLFLQATIPALRAKSIQLTAYLEQLIDELNEQGSQYRFITPRDPNQRGAQLSFLTGPDGKKLFDYLAANGVICDWRENNLTADGGGVIRIAPAPMYNSFEDVFDLVELMRNF
jgi:kynureninase